MPHSFSLQPLSPIYDALNSINARRLTGEDELDHFFLKLSALLFTEPLTYIFNVSLSTGIVTSVWEMAHVIPLHEGGDISDLNNYRPISKLYCLAKILESSVYHQLKPFLPKYLVLSPHQFGFREKHNTISATTLVVNNIVTAFDNSKCCAALFVDLSKAFDTVDNLLLLQKLYYIGFDTKAHSWFQSYLSERLQSVKSGNVQS